MGTLTVGSLPALPVPSTPCGGGHGTPSSLGFVQHLWSLQ